MCFNEVNHFFIKASLTYKSLNTTDVEVAVLDEVAIFLI